eukprot:s5558_g1.t1
MCGRARKKCTSDGATGRAQYTFSVGAFAAGGTCGVQNNTRLHPWATRLLTALVHGACSAHYFSSCTLLTNVMHYKHKDRNNEVHTMNLLIPCSRWRGGQIWIADEAGSVRLASRSEPGCLRAVQLPFVTLDPHVAHATYPWTDGERILLIAHHAKGLEALRPEDCSLLRHAGIQLDYVETIVGFLDTGLDGGASTASAGDGLLWRWAGRDAVVCHPVLLHQAFQHFRVTRQLFQGAPSLARMMLICRAIDRHALSTVECLHVVFVHDVLPRIKVCFVGASARSPDECEQPIFRVPRVAGSVFNSAKRWLQRDRAALQTELTRLRTMHQASMLVF